MISLILALPIYLKINKHELSLLINIDRNVLGIKP